MGFESASRMETKELCGVTWPSKVKERMGTLSAPLLPLEKFLVSKYLHCLRA